jgi:PAS domain S-box-containing protein
MKPQDFTFKTEEFEELFPFYLMLDENLKIEQKGKSMTKVLKDCLNKPFIQHFEIERPKINLENFDSFLPYNNQLIIINSISKKNLKFRGQLYLKTDSKKILLLISPWFDNTDTFISSGLLIKDFAAHNPMIDLVHIMKNQEIVNTELKELLEKVNKQKNDLSIINKENEKNKYFLEESNRRYEYVNQAITEAIWDYDIINKTMYHGNGFKKIFGFDSIVDYKTKYDWRFFVHPEDIERVNQKINNSLMGKENNWTDEFRFLKKNGEYTTIVDRALIIRNEEGKAVRMVGAMKDISKQKSEELHLKLLESVITHLNDSVVITDASKENKIVYVNDAFTKMTGYSSEESIGKNPSMLQGPQTDKAEILKMKMAIVNYESCEITTINYKKNGKEFWNNLSISPVADEKGNVTHWIAIERDVTEKVFSANEISNQKKFTEDILNNIPADIAVFDSSHNYLFLNPNAIKDDETRQWLIGKNDFDYAKHRDLSNELALTRRQIFNTTVKNKTTYEWVDEHEKDGKPRFVLRKFYPYFENDILRFVIGYGIDITELKYVQIQLNQALENIQKSNNELEQFAYVASHDLQEPLRMVTSFLTQLEKKYTDKLDEKAKEYIFYAVDGAKRMRQIILDLLEFSRVGKSDEALKEIQTKELSEEILILYRKQIQDLHAVITFKHLPVIKSYKTPIRQVFQNLIGNSLKYHKKDVPPIIEVDIEDQNKFWKFSFKDNGIGINSQYFDKIFTIFQRLHNKEEYSGTGIGLAITKKIINNLGGEIWVESKEKVGTTFYFTLPK